MPKNVLLNRNPMDSCKEQAEIERNRQNRIKEVRLQSNIIAQKLRESVRNERENQMKRLEKLKEIELMEWKRKNVCDLEAKYDQGCKTIGEAHRAAREEEIQMGIFKEKRDEFDLIAAQRGKCAISKEQESRRKQEEERVMKRKRLKQKNIGIQANLLDVPLHYENYEEEEEENESDLDYQNTSLCEDEEECEEEEYRAGINKNQKLKNIYNPKNFATTSNSTESSVIACKSTQSDSDESLQFNQITNLLKKKRLLQSERPECHSKFPNQDVIEISDNSDSENIMPPPLPPKQTKTAKKTPKKLPKRVIVKSPQTKSYLKGIQKLNVPDKSKNAKYYEITDETVNFRRKNEGQSSENTYSGGYSASSTTKLTSARSKETFEKERTRRDYERMREELDLLAKEQQQARSEGKKTSSYSTKQFEKAAEEKKHKMESAFENVMKNRTILTCPPVQEDVAVTSKKSRKKSSDVNVGQEDAETDVSGKIDSDSCASIYLGQKETKKSSKKSNDSLTIEKLKDLLERINYQKRLMSKELQKQEDIPGPDLENVLKTIKNLEKEKKILTSSSSESDPTKNKKETQKLLEREKKVEEREKRLEERIKELYREHKNRKLQEEYNETDSNSEIIDSPAPVEIVIKVNPKSPRSRKTKKYKVIKCIDTLSKGPGKVYPKTPIKKLQKKETRKSQSQEFDEVLDALKKRQKEYFEKEDQVKTTEESNEVLPIPKVVVTSHDSNDEKVKNKIQTEKFRKSEKANSSDQQSKGNLIETTEKSSLKTVDSCSTRNQLEKRQDLKKQGSVRDPSEKLTQPIPKKQQKSISKLQKQKDLDFWNGTDSTSYRSLPDDVPLTIFEAQKREEKTKKLNPFLMHYIARLLGMPKNVGETLGVSSTSVSTPGSSTINTSGNVSDASDPSFDSVRLDQLKKFIDENYSFLSEVNESIERSRLEENKEDNLDVVNEIWKEVLDNSAKKNQSTEKRGILKTTDQKKSAITEKSKKSVGSSKSEETSKKSKVPTISGTTRSKTEILIPRSRSTIKQAPPKRDSSAPEPRQSQIQQTQEDLPQVSRPKITCDDLLNITKYMEAHMLNNYVEYTSSCQKRIANLTDMMQRVRQEKIKLMENSTLSTASASSQQPETSKNQDDSQKSSKLDPSSAHQEFATSSGSELKSPSHREDPPSEEINNILTLKSRQIGISKDSGISMSRPPSDYRDSPENTFQPILKDIPKTQPQKASDQDLARIIMHSLSKIIQPAKKLKPPATLTRYSPQSEEKPAQPHELSTIVEVETSGTSKINITDMSKENLEYQEFQDYEKYVQSHQENNTKATNFIEEANELFKKLKDPGVQSFQKFVDPKEYGVGEISSLHQSSNHSSLENLKNPGIKSFEEFVDPKTYRIQDISSLHEKEDAEVQSNGSSIQDLVAELKRRNIITSDDDSPSSRTSTSPLKKILDNEKIVRENEAGNLGSPDKTKSKSPSKKRSTPSKGSGKKDLNQDQQNDSLSGMIPQDNNNLQGDLKNIGLNWAASTLKRTQESQTMQTSSSSSGNAKILKRTIEIQFEDSSNTPSCSNSSSSLGQPLNLKEFLKRELTVQSPKNVTNESSIGSPFIPNASSFSSTSRSSDKNFLRTSTPLEDPKSSKESTRIRLTQQNLGSQSLFPTESLSTVKMSSSGDSSKSHQDVN